MAYGPIARGRLGVAAITRTWNADHCRDGLDIFDCALDADDKAQISALDDGTRVIDPGWAPAWDRG